MNNFFLNRLRKMFEANVDLTEVIGDLFDHFDMAIDAIVDDDDDDIWEKVRDYVWGHLFQAVHGHHEKKAFVAMERPAVEGD